jgi:hypothetical protein
LTAAIVILGGLTIVAGSLMPWMTLLGGLHTYRGIIGLYGRLIAGGGVVAVALGIFLGAKASRVAGYSAAVLGCGIFFFSAFLLRNLMEVVHDRQHPMLAAAPGWGLYVCLAGGVLLSASLIALIGADNSHNSRLVLQNPDSP